MDEAQETVTPQNEPASVPDAPAPVVESVPPAQSIESAPEPELVPETNPAAETEVEPPDAPAPMPAAPEPASAPVPASAPSPMSTPAPVLSEHRWGRFSHAEVVAKALATRRAHAEAKLQKIMAYVQKKGSVSNDEVEKLDKVVDSTAALYLKQLVARGLLRKRGTNRPTRYEKSE